MKNTSNKAARKRPGRQAWAVIILLFSVGLLAQEETGDTATSEQDTVSATELPEPASPSTTASEPPATANSPFDYQASEKISEDLSVSFPVDI